MQPLQDDVPNQAVVASVQQLAPNATQPSQQLQDVASVAPNATAVQPSQDDAAQNAAAVQQSQNVANVAPKAAAAAPVLPSQDVAPNGTPSIW